MPLWLLVLSVGSVAWWLLQQQSSPTGSAPPTGPVATSPAISYAASYMPNPNVQTTPLPTGLPPNWYWQDQGNTAMIVIGDPIQAIAMSPDDVATAVYGTAVSALDNITLQVSSPAAGLASGQQVTLPLSYVTSNSLGV